MMKYAILGGGRLARHFSHYFRYLRVPHTRWARDDHASLNSFQVADKAERLKLTLEGADCALLMVADDAIVPLLEQFPFIHDRQVVHFSGAIHIEGLIGVHPLMTFADTLYEPEFYRSIPFVVDQGADFRALFPMLSNRHFSIEGDQKARYHALCVMAGNFAQLLWKAVEDQFEQHFKWPVEIAQPYLERVTHNFVANPALALTGPLVRNDAQTIESNLESLAGDPLQEIYQAFVNYYRQQQNLHVAETIHKELQQ